jgi:hypothetical protein
MVDMFAVFAAAFVLLLPFAHAYKLGYAFDSLTMQYDSVRVLHGAVPYRDFFNFPTPLTYWIQALVFRVFGVSATNAAYLLILFFSALATFLYALTYRMTGKRLVSLVPSILVLFGLAPHWEYPYHHWYGATTLVLTILIASRWLEHEKVYLLVAAGVMAGVTALFVQTQGLAAALAVGLLLVLHVGGVDQLRPYSANVVAMRVLAFAIGIAAVWLPVLGYFYLEGALHQFFYDTVVWVNSSYRENGPVNAVPPVYNLGNYLYWTFTSNTWDTPTPMQTEPLLFYSGLWMTIWLLIIPTISMLFSLRFVFRHLRGLLRRLRGKVETFYSDPESSRQYATLLLCSLATIASYWLWIESGNRDTMHMWFITVITFPTFVAFVMPILAQHINSPVAAMQKAVDGRGFLVASICAATLVWYGTVASMWWVPSVDAAFQRDPIVQYVNHHTTKRDTVVALRFGGEVNFFGRPSAITFSLLEPGGKYNTRSQLTRAAREIEQRHPKLVIFGFGLGWKQYFGFDSSMMRFARAHYGYGRSGSATTVPDAQTTYHVYTWRSSRAVS